MIIVCNHCKLNIDVSRQWRDDNAVIQSAGEKLEGRCPRCGANPFVYAIKAEQTLEDPWCVMLERI